MFPPKHQNTPNHIKIMHITFLNFELFWLLLEICNNGISISKDKKHFHNGFVDLPDYWKEIFILGSWEPCCLNVPWALKTFVLIFLISWLQKRNAKKEASERKYYEERKYVSGDWRLRSNFVQIAVMIFLGFNPFVRPPLLYHIKHLYNRWRKRIDME